MRQNSADTALSISITGTGEFNDADSVSLAATDDINYVFTAPSALTSFVVRHWSMAFPGLSVTQKTITDTGSGVDAVSVSDIGTVKSPTDVGAGADSINISASVPMPETGAGADAVTIIRLVGVADSGAGIDIPSIVEPAMLALLERFDGTLASWTLDTTGGTAQIQTVNNDEKLVLNDTSASALVSATRSIEGQSAPFCI